MKIVIWKLKMLIAKLKHPGAGYYERMCLVGGYTKKDIDNMVREAIKRGECGGSAADKWIREEVCYEDITCWN
ncbi:hypothetical protein HF072_07260 [Bacillus sp. RO3]|nr:hypothetical protein [Bacillus sp. RO3]